MSLAGYTLYGLAIALIFGSVMWLPFACILVPIRYEEQASFTHLPDDDALLATTIQRHSNVADVHVSRDGNTIVLAYQRRGMLSDDVQPDWRQLGYGDLLGARFTRRFQIADLLADRLLFMVLLLSTQGGFLAAALRLRATRPYPVPDLLRGETRDAIILGIVVGAALVLLGFIYDIILGAVFDSRINTSGPWEIVRSLPLATQATIVLLACTLVPICEELFFRGALFGAFISADKAITGAIMSGILFSVVHLTPINLPILFVFGLILAWCYSSSHSIVAPIVAHAINNIVAFALIFMDKQ